MFNSLNSVYTNFRVNNYANIKTSLPKLGQLTCDTVSFKGISPHQYKSSFDFMASNAKEFTSGKLSNEKSPSKIQDATKKYLESNDSYKKPVLASKDNNTFCPVYTEELKDEIISTINETRKETFEVWNNYIENGKTDDNSLSQEEKILFDKIQQNPTLKFVIWNALSSNIGVDNRHIPLPLDTKTLADTINFFEKKDIELQNEKSKINTFRTSQARNPKSFNDVYASKLIENTLYSIIGNKNNTGFAIFDENGKKIDNPTESTIKDAPNGLWVQIPKATSTYAPYAVSVVENLSHENWCTRSRSDKASAAIQDGNFYIYLERDNRQYKPALGITSERTGKLAKIQGVKNDNTIDQKYFDTIQSFLLNNNHIKENGQNINCCSGKDDEGPDLYGSYLIMKEKQDYPEFAKAIEKKDYKTFLSHINDIAARTNPKAKAEITADENGMLTIKNYNSTLSFNGNIAVSLSDFGIDEIDLLKHIKVATGKVNTKTSPVATLPKRTLKVTNSGNNLYETILKEWQ